MKKITNSIVYIAVIGFAAISGCKKSLLSSSPGSMTASINGTSYNASNCFDSSAGAVIYSAGQGASITLYVENMYSLTQIAASTGTYQLAGNITYAARSPLSIMYGTINITKTWPNMAGTFSFTCSDSTKVTNGSFTATNSH